MSSLLEQSPTSLRVWVARVSALWQAHPAAMIFAAALAVRVLFILFYGATAPLPEWGDDPYYDTIATGLVEKGEYVNTWYPPGYPFFLAFMYAVFGRNWFAVRLVQAVIGAAACVLTYRLGTKLFGDRVGRLAGAILVVYPGHAYMSWRIMGEPLFIFLLVLALNIAVGLAERPRLRAAVALGFVVGAGQLVKSNLYVFPFLLVAWAALAPNAPRRQRFMVAGALAAAIAVVSLATPLANFLSAKGGAATLPGNAGHTFWFANNPLADGYYIAAEKEPVGIAFIEAHGYTERLAQADEFEQDRLYGRLGLLWIQENPGRFLVLCLKKLNNAFGLFPRAQTLQGNRSAQAVHLLTYGLIAPFAIAGIIGAWRRWRALLPLYLALLSYIAMVLIYYGTPRFTILVMPVLIIFAGAALVTCVDYLTRVLPVLAPARATLGEPRGTLR